MSNKTITKSNVMTESIKPKGGVSFQVERTIPVSASKLWNVVGEQYADVSKYHSGIISSELINGFDKSELGAERICKLDNDGKKYVEERLTEYDPEKMRVKALLYHGSGVPTVGNKTYAAYDVTPIDDGHAKLTITQVYATKPAFLGRLLKGKFKKYTEEHAVFVEHYATTGEAVNKSNSKDILKKYAA